MKNSKFFLTTLFAAAAMGASAYGAGEVISINFGQTADNITAEMTGNAGLVTYTDGSGATVTGVGAAGWSNATGQNGTNSELKNYNGDTIEGASVTWVGAQGPWGGGPAKTGSVLSAIQHSYMDLSANNTWNISVDTPFLVCDVYLYFSGDGNKYSPVNVNGISYIGGANILAGTATEWGDRGQTTSGTLALGTNAILVTGTAGIVSLSNVPQNDSAKRATISGMQIVETYAGTAHAATLGGDAAWSGVSFDTAWANSQSTVDAATGQITSTNGAYADFTLTADATLTFDSAVVTDAIYVSGEEKTLTLSNAGSGSLTLSGPATLRANAGATIAFDTTAFLFNLADNVSGVKLAGSGTIEFTDADGTAAYGKIGTDFTVASATTVRIDGAVTLDLGSDALVFSGVSREFAGGLSVSGLGLGVSSGATVTISGGASSFTGGISSTQISGILGSDNSVLVSGSGSVLNITGGTLALTQSIGTHAGGVINQSGGTVNTTALRLHDSGGASGTSTYNLSGGVLNISSTNTDTSPTEITHLGVLIGHWGQGKGLLSVTGGVLNAANTVACVSYSSPGEMSISGGEVNLKGINLTGQGTNAAMVTLSGNGRLNVGSAGLATGNNGNGTKKYNLNGGTLGALEDTWSTGAGVTLNVGGAVEIDTTKRVVSDSGASTVSTDGATITLGNIAFADAGALTVSGAGTLKLDGVVSGVTADSAAKITLNGGTLELGDNLKYAFTGADDSLVGKTLNIAVVNGGTVTGTLSSGDFTWNGKPISARTDVTLDGNAGTVTFGDVGAYNLFWKGASGGTWDSSSTTVFGKDSAEGEGTAFVDIDNVTFNIAATETASTYTVNVSSVLTPGDVVTDVGENVTLRFNLSAANQIAGSGTWTKTGAGVLEISSSLSGSRTGDMIVEAGTLRLATDSDTLRAFGTGTLEIKAGGTLDLNGKNSALVSTPIKIAGNGADGNGAVVNNASNEIGTGQQQFANVTLTADASVGGTKNFGTIAGGYGSHSFNLVGFTLTKKGSNTFYVANTQFTAGTINVESGTFRILNNGGNSNAEAVDFIFSGGALTVDAAANSDNPRTFTVKSLSGNSGSVTIGENSTLTIAGGTESNLGVAVTGAGTLTLNNGGTLRFTNGVNQTFTKFNIYGTTIVESGVTLDLTNNSRSENSGGNGALIADGGIIRMADLGWGATKNFGANFNYDRLQLANGGVLEVTAAQADGTGAGQRGFAITGGTGTYRYTGAEASYIVSGEANQLVSVSDGAELVFDITDASGSLTVSKVIAKGTNTSSGNPAHSTSSLRKTGAGSLALSGTVNLSGGFAVDAGSVTISSADFCSGTITVANGATLAFTDTTKFNLANLEDENGIYTLVVNDGGTLSGTENLGTDDFLNAPSRGIASVNVTEGGITATSAARVLTWNGSGATPTWNTAADNLMWTYNGGTASDFQNDDSVEFTANAAGTVTVGEAVRAKTVKFTGGEYTLAGSGSISSAGGVLVTGTGTVLSLSTGGGQSIIHGVLTIENGGVVKLTTGDATGWGGGANAINTLVINGGELVVATNGNQTFNMSGGITLSGAKISKTADAANANIDLYSSTLGITTLASSVTSEIDVNLGLRRNDTAADAGADIEFNVADGDAEVDLLVSGKVRNLSYTNDRLKKLGGGVMKLTGDNAEWTTGGTIAEGTLIAASGTALGTGAISVASGAKLVIEDASADGYSYANAFTLAGELEKTGAGATTLSGTVEMGTATLNGGTSGLTVGSLKYGRGDGVNTATIQGKVNVTGDAQQSSNGQVDGEIVSLAGGAEMTVGGTFGTREENAYDLAQVGVVLNIGDNASLSAANIANGNDFDVTLGANATLSATTALTLNAIWGDKTHSFTGAGADSSQVSAGTVALTSANSVLSLTNLRLDVGNGGISGTGRLVLNNAALGVRDGADGWSTSLNAELSGTVVADAAADKSITLGGVLSGTGALTKSGAGTLVLDPNGGTNNFSGAVTLAGGALEIAGAGALGTSGNVVFAATGTSFGATAATTLSDLTLTFGDVFATETAAGVSLSNITFSNATIEFSDAAQFATAGTVLLLSGYTGTTSDFNLNYVGDGRIYVDAGNLYFSTFMGDLYWNGAVNDVWNTTDANWTEDGVTNRTFVNASSVTFRTADAAVQLAGAFSVSTMTVSESVAFSAAEGAEASSISVNYTDLTIDPGKTLTIGEGVTLDLSGGDAQAGVSRSDILGSGTVKLKLTTTYTNALSLDGFAGTTYVTAGNFRINDAKFGDTLHLAGGVNFELSGGSTVELGAGKNLVLDGTTQVHQNSSANLTFNGSVTGAGTYDRRGAGTLTFNGAVALGGFLQQDNSNDGAVTTFGGTADFANGATLNFAKGSASFNGATTFGDNATLTHSSSSALSFSAPVTFGSGATITHSNGTLTFGGATTFGDGATLTISTGNLASISFTNSLSVGENLKIYYGGSPNASTTLAIGELALSGASTTLTTQNWHGAYQIGKLSLAAGTASATLNLVSEQTSALFSVYELGASGVTDSGDFAGTINVSSTNGGDTRSASLVLSDANIAKNAVVNLATLASPGAQLALGVNAASVTVGGLESAEAVGDRAKVYSGKVAYGAEGGAAPGDGTTRALVIDTTAHADTEHVFRGVIGADLALTKTGAGTQVLTNAGNAFAALEVSGGTLAATNVGALGAADSVTLTDGTLELRGVSGADNDAAEFAKSLTGAGTFALTNTSKVAVAADGLSGFTGTLNVADEASMQVSAAADSETTVGATLDGAGTFEKLGDGTLALSAAAAADRTGSTTVSAGTLALTNASALGSGEVSLAAENATLELRGLASFGNTVNSDAGAGKLALTGGSNLTMNFGDQLSNFGGKVDLGAGTRLNLGINADDVAAFSGFGNAASIGANATLGIDAGAADAAFAMALSGTGTLEKLGTGTLTLAAAPADAFTGTLKIKEGTLKLDGTWTLNNDVAGTGALEISGKITAHASKFTSEFTGATTVLENSELEIWTDTTGSLSTAVTGAGTLTKTGAGTLSLAAGTTVKTVDLRAGGLAGVNLGSGQTLKISYDDVTLSGTNTLTAGTLSFLDGNSALTKLTIADGTTTVGGDLKIDVNVAFPSVTNPSFETGAEVSHVNTYTLIEVASGATLDGWDTLTKDNFLVNGVEITSHRESVLTNVAPGQISLELKSFDLLWNGGNGVWNVGGNAVWTRADATGTTFVETYMNSDRVTFAGTATVTLGEDVAPETIEVTGGGTLTLDCGGHAVKHGRTTIKSGSTLALTIGDAAHAYFAAPVTVSGAGTLKLDMNADADLATLIAGTISGTNGLTFEKAGTKTLTISDGANSKLAGFTADNVVSVSAGTLVIKDGFASIGGAELNVGRDATAKALLTFDESLSNRISGSGTFVKQGAGTLTLSADSTAFSGSLFVDEGTVRLEDANGMGDAALGTDVTVNPDGTLVLAFSDAVYNKNFHGTGTIVADNGEKLTLRGGEGDFSGDFVVNGGLVSAQLGGSFGAGTIVFADADKAVEFKLTEVGAFAGSFSGEGTATLAAGSKELTLSGASSDGFAGTLKVETSAVAEHAEVLGSADATVEIGAAGVLSVEAGTLKAKLAGSGMLAKTGADTTLTLANADNADFTGRIAVKEGALSVSDAAALGATRGVELSAGATLDIVVRAGETFTLDRAVTGEGDLVVRGEGDGTHAFVYGLSGKNFHGNMTFSGVSAVSASNFTADDGLLRLTNAATWDARGGVSIGERSVLTLLSTRVSAAADVRTTSADSEAGIASTLTSGGFRASSGVSGSVELSGISVTPTTTASGEAGAVLSFGVDSRPDARVAPIALSGDGSVTLNNVSVEVLLGGDLGSAFDVSEIRLVDTERGGMVDGSGVDSATIVLADGSEVEYHYRNGWLTLEAVPTGMNLAYAAMVTLPTETFSQDVRSLHRRMEQRRFGVEDRNEWQFFAQAQTMSADTGSDKSDSATFDYSTYGALVGADVRVGESTLFGLALAYDRGTADIHDDQGEITSDAYRATLYAGTVFADYLYAEAGAHVGFASNEIDRKGDYDRNKGDADAWSAGAFATVGGVIPTGVDGFFLTPHVGVAYLTTHVESFEERGTSAMDVDSISADSLRASVGLGAQVAFGFGEVPTRFTLDVSYSRECLDDDVDAKIRTEDGSLTRTEKAFAEDVISVGAGLDFSLSKNTGVFLNYTADFGLNSDVTHRADAGFRFTW